MPEPIRILRVIARLNMGGPAIHVSNLAAGLETRGYHTTLVAGSLPRGEDSMAYVAERLGVSVVDVPEIQREVAPLHDRVGEVGGADHHPGDLARRGAGSNRHS